MRKFTLLLVWVCLVNITAKAQISTGAGLIIGLPLVCEGATTTYTDGTMAGGTWSSSNTSIATVGAANGVVTGVYAGFATISYTATDASGVHVSTLPVLVQAHPNAGIIAGLNSICIGGNITVTDSAATTDSSIAIDTWRVSNGHATARFLTGTITGVSVGVDTITLSAINICGSAVATHTVSIIPATGSSTITGAAVVCAGATIPLVNTWPGGTWTSSNTSIATVDPATGIVTGVTAGRATITCVIISSCRTVTSTKIITVNPLPNPGVISGIPTVCVGAHTNLTESVSGGTWSSSNTAIATVSTTGVVTGAAAGSTIISYAVTTICGTAYTTATVTVAPLPSAGTISGTATVCTGATTNLTETVSGGTWSSSNTAIATISTTGVVTGISAGNTTISYAVTTACGTAYTTATVTIVALPSAGLILGSPTVCAGATTNFSETLSGGTWSSGNTTIATVSATGVVTGVSAGSTTISYTYTNSCGTANTAAAFTVATIPNAGIISGTDSVCTGAIALLTDASATGTWASGNTTIATVDAVGNVTGVSVGTTNITLTVTNSCGAANTAFTMTVDPLPDAGTITGTTSVCAGATTNLNETVFGGNWSSSDPTIATVSASGIVTGVSAGSTTISYTYNNSCGTAYSTTIVTVTALPNAGSITGTDSICVGANTLLTDASTTGIWTSGNTAIATVDATGNVTGVSVGNTNMTFTATNSCGTAFTQQTITVLSFPVAGLISGSSSVCAGATTILTDTTSGGVWSSSDRTIVRVNRRGVVTAVSAGTAIISYTNTNICGTANTTASITVAPLPDAGAITGTASVCVGTNTNLNETVSGGTWTSSDPTIATVSTSGIVTGVSAGTVIISYSVTNSCGTAYTTTTAIVAPLPNAGSIIGVDSVCIGASTLLTDTGSVGTGAWTSSNTTIAVVDATGNVTGVSVGNTNITFTATNSCGTANISTKVTVDPLPSAGIISGTTFVCAGNNINLIDTVTGGIWGSNNPSIATVNTTGMVFGLSAGTTTISYSVTNSCGTNNATAIVTVGTLPNTGTINGASSLCAGAITNVTETSSGGTWSSSDITIATVSTSGIVTGFSTGTAIISYEVTNSCGTVDDTMSINVMTAPTVNPITGNTSQCLGAIANLNDATTGGAWSSSDPSIVSISSTGVVTGNSLGIASISYLVTNSIGCSTSVSISDTVQNMPAIAVINGISSMCPGTTTTLTDAVTGGTWSSSDPTIISIDATTGAVTARVPGIVNITYTTFNGLGCTNTSTLADTVLIVPSTSPITGTTIICIGTATTLSDIATGGTWGSSNTAIATVSGAGVVNGVSIGSAIISYSVINICGSVIDTFTINVGTAPSVGSITGNTSQCLGSTASLTDVTAGGNWTSSDPTIASISTTGVVTANSLGMVTINYLVTNSYGCSTNVSIMDTVQNSPAIAAINGVSSLCAGSATILTDAVTGGVWSSSDPTIASIDPATGAVTALASGTTNITYTTFNGLGCYTTSIMADTVFTAPLATPITGTSIICIGNATTLSDITTGGTWGSSNTAIATVSSTGVVNGISIGSATISYTLSNSCGTVNNTLSVNVGTAPIVSPITGATSLCLGSILNLTDDTTGGTWSSSDPSIAYIDATGMVVGNAAGIATIGYNVTNSFGCSTTVTLTDTVENVPPMAVINGASTVCAGGATSLTDAISGGVWSSSDPTIAIINSVSGMVAGIAPGLVTIYYTAYSGSGCSNYSSMMVTVSAAPTVAPITGASDICLGSSTALSDITTGGTWYSSNNSITTVTTGGLVTAVGSGIDTIFYTVINASGCIASTAFAESVDTVPVSTILPNTGASICNNNPVNLEISATAPGYGYQWYLNGSMIPGATHDSYIADTAGLYTADIFYGSCRITLSGTMVISQPQPDVDMLGGDTLYAGTFNSYQWLLNGNVIPGATDSIYTITTTGGDYQVIVSNMYGCVDTSIAFHTSSTLGIANVGNGGMNIKLFPNPTTSELQIQAPEKVNVKVTTQEGKVVMEADGTNVIDMSNLADAMYIVMVYNKNNVLLLTGKIMKMK